MYTPLHILSFLHCAASILSGHLVCQQYIWAKLNNSVYYVVWPRVRAGHALHLYQNIVPGVVPIMFRGLCQAAEESTVAECVR